MSVCFGATIPSCAASALASACRIAPALPVFPPPACRRLHVTALLRGNKTTSLEFLAASSFYSRRLANLTAHSEGVTIPKNPRTERSVGYAFVDLSTPTEAERAIAELSGKEILERKVSVQLARKPEAGAEKIDSNGEGEGNRRRQSTRGRGRGGRARGGRTARGREVSLQLHLASFVCIKLTDGFHYTGQEGGGWR